MAYGVDIWAGELVLEQRKKHRDIHLIAAVPFEGFDSHWDESWKKRYKRLLKKADEVNFPVSTSKLAMRSLHPGKSDRQTLCP